MNAHSLAPHVSLLVLLLLIFKFLLAGEAIAQILECRELRPSGSDCCKADEGRVSEASGRKSVCAVGRDRGD